MLINLIIGTQRVPIQFTSSDIYNLLYVFETYENGTIGNENGEICIRVKYVSGTRM